MVLGTSQSSKDPSMDTLRNDKKLSLALKPSLWYSSHGMVKYVHAEFTKGVGHFRLIMLQSSKDYQSCRPATFTQKL